MTGAVEFKNKTVQAGSLRVTKTWAGDLAVTGVLYLSEDRGEDYCRAILTAIHFEKK